MAAQQRMMAENMRVVADELRASVSNAQSSTSQSLEKLLAALGDQVGEAIGRLQGGSENLAVAHRGQMEEISAQTKVSLAELAGAVEAQTNSIADAASAMRSAIGDLGAAVNANINSMAEGAGEIRLASEQLLGSGRAVGDVLNHSRVVAGEFTQVAQMLSASAQDVRTVVGDYRSARDAFGSIVDGLKETITNARRDVAMTSDMIRSMDAAVQKLIAAQGEADAYLGKVSDVIRESHGSFTTSMVETLRETNTEFHKHLGSSVSLLAGSIEELDLVLGNLPASAKELAYR
jgi:hypothetical protein